MALNGIHLLVLLGMLAFLVLVVAAIAVGVYFLVRRAAAAGTRDAMGPPTPPTGDGGS